MTKIQWTDVTWNPVTGCTKISPGCANCYAEKIMQRFKRAVNYLPSGYEVKLHDDRLAIPLGWVKPRRIFVNSMSDLFHDDVSDEFISWVFAAMSLTPQHTYQILTKRPERMRDYLAEMSRDPDAYCFAWASGLEWAHPRPLLNATREWPLPNVWLGVSVENQYWADRRIPLLLETPAALRFVSGEPLLKDVDFGPALGLCRNCGQSVNASACGPLHAVRATEPSIDWLILGGESGPKSRFFDVRWARLAQAQCRAAGVPYFLKQLGTAYAKSSRLEGDYAASNPLNWPEDLRLNTSQIPEGN